MFLWTLSMCTVRWPFWEKLDPQPQTCRIFLCMLRSWQVRSFFLVKVAPQWQACRIFLWTCPVSLQHPTGLSGSSHQSTLTTTLDYTTQSTIVNYYQHVWDSFDQTLELTFGGETCIWIMRGHISPHVGWGPRQLRQVMWSLQFTGLLLMTSHLH